MKAATPGALAEAAVAAAGAGATIGQIASMLAGDDDGSSHRCRSIGWPSASRNCATPPMPTSRRPGRGPKIFLANLGTVAQHTGRATFAKNFFEVAGIEAISNAGFTDAAARGCRLQGQRRQDRHPVLHRSGLRADGARVAQALKAAGCEYLFLAGNPGDKRETYTAAGIDDFIFMGGDLLQTDPSTLARLGVI